MLPPYIYFRYSVIFFQPTFSLITNFKTSKNVILCNKCLNKSYLKHALHLLT